MRQRSGDEAEECPGDETARTESSGADQAARAAALRTGSSRDKWRADAPECIIRGITRRSGHNPQDWNIRVVVSGCSAKDYTWEIQWNRV